MFLSLRSNTVNTAQNSECVSICMFSPLNYVLFFVSSTIWYPFCQGVCPGLTHAQKLGISYSDEEGNVIEQTSESHEHHGESAVESSVQVQSSNIILISHPVASQQDQALGRWSGTGDHADIVVTADSDSVSHDNTDGSLGVNTEELTKDTERSSKQSEDEDIAQNLMSNEDIS